MFCHSAAGNNIEFIGFDRGRKPRNLNLLKRYLERGTEDPGSRAKLA